MRRHYRLLAGICLPLLIAVGCRQQPQTSTTQSLPPAQVRVFAVAKEPARLQEEVTGTVEAVQQATIAAKVTGVIEELPVTLGAAVPKGALLVRIAAGETNARMSQAEAQLGQAKRNWEREKRLLAKDASTPETVRSLEDALRVAEAGYREARTMYGYTVLTAPFAGKIAQKMVNAGDLATPGQPLLVLENNSRLQVVAAVPETLVPQLKIGDSVPVSVPAVGYEGKGTVAEIASASDAASRSALVKLAITDAANLRSGQYARVILPGTVAAETLLVPATAVMRLGQMERLFVVQEAKARLRLVRTGDRHGDQVEILAGLNPGEQVVVQGNEHLVDGQPLQIVP